MLFFIENLSLPLVASLEDWGGSTSAPAGGSEPLTDHY